jgi:hypothetical protein
MPAGLSGESFVTQLRPIKFCKKTNKYLQFANNYDHASMTVAEEVKNYSTNTQPARVGLASRKQQKGLAQWNRNFFHQSW